MAERLDKLGKEEWVDARMTTEADKVEAMDDTQRAQYKRLDARFQVAEGALRALEEVYRLRALLQSRDQRIKEAVMAVLWPGERQGRFAGPIFEWGHETTPTLAEVEEIADEIVAASQPPVALSEEERK